VAAGSLATWVAPATVHADPDVARDAAVIIRWNEITERTLADNGVPILPSGLYFAFSSLAVYDAVVTIEDRYEPRAQQPRAHVHASSEVAAATAAYQVLSHFFAASQAALAADYAAELGDIPDRVGKVPAVRVGEAAAAELIHRRRDDGRGADVPQPSGPPFEPGE
jgi:hypothetical protein